MNTTKKMALSLVSVLGDISLWFGIGVIGVNGSMFASYTAYQTVRGYITVIKDPALEAVKKEFGGA